MRVAHCTATAPAHTSTPNGLISTGSVPGADGIARCALILDPALVRVAAVPRRAFQGWRYLEAADAPPDLPASRAEETALPHRLARELAAMGLL